MDYLLFKNSRMFSLFKKKEFFSAKDKDGSKLLPITAADVCKNVFLFIRGKYG